MQVDLGALKVRARLVVPVAAGRSPKTVIASFTARKAVRSGGLWGYVFGVLIASSEVTYGRIYASASQRQALAATYGANKAMSALFGPAPRLQTVGGFTAFKVSMTLMILGALWGLLAGTRLLRGEEDHGRWDLLLTGQTTRRGATAQTMLGLSVGLGALWLVAAVIAVFSGRLSSVDIGVTSSLYFVLAMVATAAMFLAVGAVASQLAPTRRQAVWLGAVVLGTSYLLRLVADAGIGVHGLIWTSPLGWVEELRPLTSPRPLALLPIVVFIAALAVVAIALAGVRDAGAGIVADHADAAPRLGLLFGPTGLWLRLMRPTVSGWFAALSLSAFLYGLIAKATGATVRGSFEQVLSKVGAPGTGADAVLGVCFLIEAILISLLAAGQVTAARVEESAGLLENVIVRAGTRASWLGGRLALALVVMGIGGALVGLFAWLGAASQHTGLSVGSLLGAGLNLVPPAIVVLGIGALAFGVWPRAAPAVVYGVVGWSALVVIVGGFGAINHWALDTSVFHQMASAPDVRPNWRADGVMSAVGFAAALIGTLGFTRRDLQGA